MGKANGPAPKWDVAQQLDIFERLPIIHEDDPELDVGEANLHSLAEHILRYGIAAHLEPMPQYRVFSNLNLHYQPRFPSIYVSPDVMVATPTIAHADELRSYRVGEDGPNPQFIAEVLSERTAQVHDLDEKVYIYAMMGIPEYLLVDVERRFLSHQLVLKRLRKDRKWKGETDTDGGVTSRLGFRVVFEDDGRLRVIDAASGRRYARPDEAEVQARAREKAEDRIRALEAELAQLRGTAKKRKAP